MKKCTLVTSNSKRSSGMSYPDQSACSFSAKSLKCCAHFSNFPSQRLVANNEPVFGQRLVLAWFGVKITPSHYYVEKR